MHDGSEDAYHMLPKRDLSDASDTYRQTYERAYDMVKRQWN